MDAISRKNSQMTGCGIKEIEIKNINGVPYFFVPITDTVDGNRPVPHFDTNVDYSKECEWLRMENESIVSKIEQADEEIKEIKLNLQIIEKNKRFLKTKKYKITHKRDRRKSFQIVRMFKCDLCDKSYG
jgi:hypothetical protein